MKPRHFHLPLFFITLLVTGCRQQTPAPPQSDLPTVQMKIGAASYTLEIAANEFTRDHGLMQRDSMPSDHGMIFVFDDEAPRNFWMKNTRIPLDIIYLDSAGKIVSIHQMKPYDETAIPSDGPAKYAIELNLNTAANSGVKPGNHLDIPPRADAELRK